MDLDGCHYCRNHQTKTAMNVNIATDGIISDFHGIFDLIIHPKETEIFFAISNQVVSKK